jgi:AbrB family looped-hinge helix DNA binding protein
LGVIETHSISFTVKAQKSGRITIPKKYIEALDISVGDHLVVTREDNGQQSEHELINNNGNTVLFTYYRGFIKPYETVKVTVSKP